VDLDVSKERARNAETRAAVRTPRGPAESRTALAAAREQAERMGVRLEEERESGRVQRRELLRLQREVAFLQEALDAKGPEGSMQKELVQARPPPR